ncbi:MAG TPA: GntR family transcriptional regulator [Vicinamibacterales bacterium]|nr:GntR family transcriptional regulator [Vicinamibacterales bacterium]
MDAKSDSATLSSKVYAVVRRRILRGFLQPGQPLSRRRLAVELKMSIVPVNEALQRLEVEGLLESRPRAGTRVRIPSEEAVRGHYVVREALEVQAAVRAADFATTSQLAGLTSLARELDALGSEAEPRSYATLHHGFHRRIATYSRCKALVEAIDLSNALAALWLCRPSPGGSRHQELADALSSRDQTTAAEAMRQHITAGLQKSLEGLEPYFTSGTGSRSFTRGRRRVRRVNN